MPGKEIRQQAGIASDEEVPEVVSKHSAGMRVHEHVADHQIFAAAHGTDVVERLPGVRERKAGEGVERLAIAALVVELSGDRGVQREQRRGDGAADDQHAQRASPLPAACREQNHRHQHEQVRRLREGRQPDEQRGDVVGRRARRGCVRCGATGAAGCAPATSL